jgi:hypothetical protein
LVNILSALPSVSAPERVSAEEAREVTPQVPEPDKLAYQEKTHLHEQALQKAELGTLGGWLGARSEKSGNIAFIVILFSFLMVFSSYWHENGATEAFFKVFSAMIGLIGLALGYLFGASARD